MIVVRHVWEVCRHKWFVARAGLWTGASWWRLLTHDLSKLSPAECIPYARFTVAKDRSPAACQAFDRAWHHHVIHNDHHWEHWVLTGDHTERPSVLPMPDAAVRELVADWLGSCRSYDGYWPSPTRYPWLVANFPKIRLAPETRVLVASVMTDAYVRMGHHWNQLDTLRELSRKQHRRETERG